MTIKTQEWPRLYESIIGLDKLGLAPGSCCRSAPIGLVLGESTILLPESATTDFEIRLTVLPLFHRFAEQQQTNDASRDDP